MSRTQDFTETIVDWVDGRISQNMLLPLWLGGGIGPSGGNTYRRFDGQLTQKQVTFDTTEAATPWYPARFGTSLVDNLNRMRHWFMPASWFKVDTVSSGLRVHIEEGIWYPEIGTLVHFAGGQSPTITLPNSQDRIDVLYIDTAGNLVVEEGTESASPTITFSTDPERMPLYATYITPSSTAVLWSGGPNWIEGQAYIKQDLRPFLNWWAGGGGGGMGGGAGGAATPVFQVDGTLINSTTVGGAYIVPGSGTIGAIYTHCKDTGSAGNTIIDVNKNGTTLFTTQPNRPILAWDDPDKIAKGIPDITAVVENDLITIDIDQVATGAAGLTVVMEMTVSEHTFIGLPDTPITYSGYAGKYPRVNSGESGLEFVTVSGAGGDMGKTTYDTNDNGVVDNSEELDGYTLTQVRDHNPKAHTHVETDITDLDHDAQKIKGKTVDNTDIGDNKVLAYKLATDDLKYVTQSGGGGGGGWTLISETVLTGNVTGVTFTSIPQTYRSLVLRCQARSDLAGGTDNLSSYLNDDTGANYDRTQLQCTESLGATVSVQRAESVMHLGYCEGASARASTWGPTFIEYLGYAKTDREKWVVVNTGSVGAGAADTDFYMLFRRNCWRSTAAITKIELHPAAGTNFVSGCIFTLYGVL